MGLFRVVVEAKGLESSGGEWDWDDVAENGVIRIMVGCGIGLSHMVGGGLLWG